MSDAIGLVSMSRAGGLSDQLGPITSGFARSGYSTFEEAIAAAERAAAAGPGKQARQAAEQLVSIALVQPLLAEMRKGTLMADGPFKPGAYEKQFIGMFDAEIASRVVRSSNFPIVGAIEQQLIGRARADHDTAVDPARTTALQEHSP